MGHLKRRAHRAESGIAQIEIVVHCRHVIEKNVLGHEGAVDGHVVIGGCRGPGTDIERHIGHVDHAAEGSGGVHLAVPGVRRTEKGELPGALGQVVDAEALDVQVAGDIDLGGTVRGDLDGRHVLDGEVA